MTPDNEAELAEILTTHYRNRQPLRIRGGGNRVETDHLNAPVLSTAGMSGIVTYSPGEMTLIAKAGTRLAEIESMLLAEGQSLAFEPAHSDNSTIGGVVAANASGPRRVLVGACRDHLLGVRFVDGQGRILKNGGRVMKNVTGLDLSKLMAGAHGTLGVLTEMVLKTLPTSEARATLVFANVDEAQAVQIFIVALATPFEISGAAYHNGTAWLRIEGLTAQISYRRDRLLAMFAGQEVEILDQDTTSDLWRNLRDVTHFGGNDPLWRILVKPSDAPGITAQLHRLGGKTSLDWGGGLIWYSGPGNAPTIRQIVPHATIIRRGGVQGSAFAPQSAAIQRLSDSLRQSFDPAGILNPGLMDP